MKGEMEAANTGARENIALLQKDLDAARAESAELQTKLDEANTASSEAADKLSDAETRLSEAEKARETLEKTLDAAQKETTRSPAARRPMSCSSRRRPRWSRAIMPPSAAISRRSGPMPTP